MQRFYCAEPLTTGQTLTLPAGSARHVQVLRLQPGDSIILFSGRLGGEFEATILHMGRSEVQVQVGNHHAVEREPRQCVHLAVGMPANDRMDWLVEKATELGVASIQPLMTERSVLRLKAERAEKKVAHWHSVAIASSEQCGGNRVPTVHPVRTLTAWLQSMAGQNDSTRLLLSLRDGCLPLHQRLDNPLAQAVTFLSGPEGGLSAQEELAAVQAGFAAVTLGPRILRAETAALAALSALVI